MASNGRVNARKQRQVLSPSQKCELYVTVLCGQGPNVLERCFNRLKQFRALATRSNFLTHVLE